MRTPFSRRMRHPHIADAISEHTENVTPHPLPVDRRSVVTVIGVFLIAERRTAAINIPLLALAWCAALVLVDACRA